eukprot:203001_1
MFQHSKHWRTKVCVSGIPLDWNEDGIRNHFSKFGDISSLNLCLDKITQCPRGIIEYKNQHSAVKCIATCDGKPLKLGGRRLTVKYVDEQSTQQSIPKTVNIDISMHVKTELNSFKNKHLKNENNFFNHHKIPMEPPLKKRKLNIKQDTIIQTNALPNDEMDSIDFRLLKQLPEECNIQYYSNIGFNNTFIIFGKYLWYMYDDTYHKISHDIKSELEWKDIFVKLAKKRKKSVINNLKDKMIKFTSNELLQYLQSEYKWKGFDQILGLIKLMKAKCDNVFQYNESVSDSEYNGDYKLDCIKNDIFERKSVFEWNYYAIIYWLNRVNNGQFNGLKYMNLKRYICIGQVRGNQLCHLNEVTLRMLGIYDMNDIELILNEIFELVSKDEFNNIIANVLCNDNVPDMYCDPISFELMNEPVLVKPSGYIYENEWIKNYVRKYNKDPLTRQQVCMNQIIDDDCLKKRIVIWKQNNVACFSNQNCNDKTR